MHHIHLDFETYCDIDIRTAGHYRYCSDKTFEVLIFAYAIDDGPVHLVDLGHDPFMTAPQELIDVLAGPHKIIAHNAAFEMACLRSEHGQDIFGGYKVDPKNFVCTAALAAYHALPRSLGEAAHQLGLKEKDYVARNDMLFFAKKQRHGTGYLRRYRWDDQGRWSTMCKYCVQDVEVEREIHRSLEPMPAEEQLLWELDETINYRGIRVDVPLAKKIIGWNEELKARLRDRCMQITDGIAPTQVQRLVEWFRGRGHRITDLRAETVRDLLKSDALGDDDRRVLSIRQKASKTSVAKYLAMVEGHGADDRIRGAFLYHGASTGRWAGRLVQLHNLPRGIKLDPWESVEILHTCETLDDVSMFFPKVADTFSTVIRPALMAGEGKRFYVADYTGIEARVLGWVADEQNYQSAFRDGLDLYKVQAAGIYKTPYDMVTKDQRQLGKAAVLGLGYQMGLQTFINTCQSWGIQVADHLLEAALRGYRESNPAIVKLWRDLGNAAVETVSSGTPTRVGVIRFEMSWCGRFLQMVLPSGRKLHYPFPKIEVEQKDWGPVKQVSYCTLKNGMWVRTRTYGGKLTENAVQAVARDLLRDGMFNIEADGRWSIVGHVHDELIAEGDPGLPLGDFCSLMAQVPDWAQGCIYDAEGWVGPRYKKD